jgi:hypothetical protein
MLRIAAGKGAGKQVEFNTPTSPFPVETELFKGTVYFRLRGCAHEPKDYFFGKQRRLSAVVQGRFSKPLVMGECYTGYEFAQPFKNVPAPWLIRAGLSFIRTLAPTLVEDILGRRPYFLNPLCQTIQVLHICDPGDEPPITDVLYEQNAKLGGVFAEQRRSDRIKRKHYFASAANGARAQLAGGEGAGGREWRRQRRRWVRTGARSGTCACVRARAYWPARALGAGAEWLASICAGQSQRLAKHLSRGLALPMRSAGSNPAARVLALPFPSLSLARSPMRAHCLLAPLARSAALARRPLSRSLACSRARLLSRVFACSRSRSPSLALARPRSLSLRGRREARVRSCARVHV